MTAPTEAAMCEAIGRLKDEGRPHSVKDLARAMDVPLNEIGPIVNQLCRVGVLVETVDVVLERPSGD